MKSIITLNFVTRMLDFFSFNHPATPVIYTLSLHDALPISLDRGSLPGKVGRTQLQHHLALQEGQMVLELDRKSTRLNSSHRCISYAVFCLKKKITNRDRHCMRCEHWRSPCPTTAPTRDCSF